MKRIKSVIYHSLLAGVSALLLFSCEPYCIDGNGFIISEDRFVSAFTEVENTTSVDVEIIADSTFSVEVTADENLLQFINTYVRHGSLIIETESSRCFSSSGYISVEVHMPALEAIELSGSGDIEVFDFDCTYLEITNSGSGDIDMVNIFCTNTIDIALSGSGDVAINGKAKRGDYFLTGSGDIIADNLRVDDAYITTSGSGDIYCYVYDKLNVILTGSGDVYYTGNPVIDLKNSGSGKLRER